MATIGRFFGLSRHSCFLFGPRGTGKTTLLRERLPHALHINLLQPDTHRELVARPERLREMIAGSRPRDVVIDEVQRVPELLHVVHDLIEQPEPPRFVLTGSSARKLRRGGVDLLAGRALLRTLHPFMGAELPHFDLAQALELGLVPLVVDAADPAATLRAYAALYLTEEVQAEGLVRNIGAFARFLEVLSFSQGAVLNVSNVARETGVSRKTVEGYLEIVVDLLLAFRVPVFTRRAQRATVAHPKFFFFDAGVYRSLRPRGPLDRPEEIEGAALEGLVAQHLRAWIAYGGDSSGDYELAYWRTRSGVETDFVLYGPGGFHAIEVKNAAHVRPAHLRSLDNFGKDYPEAELVLLYRGADRMRIGRTLCVPVDEFLRGLKPGHALMPD
ncbi:MAG: ATP-binding protein [Gemmatimonadota bacterium]